MISQEKLKIFTPLQKIFKNERDLGRLIVATGFEKLPNLVTLLMSQLRPVFCLLLFFAQFNDEIRVN